MRKRISSSVANLLIYGSSYTLASVIQKGVGFLVFMYLAKTMSVSEYASFGLKYAGFAGLAALSLAGVFESSVGRLKSAKSKKEIDVILGNGQGLFFILALIFTLLFALVVVVFNVNQFGNWFSVSFIITGAVLHAYFLCQSNLLRLKENHKTALFLFGAPPLIAFISGFCFVIFFDTTSYYYFFGAGVGYLFVLLILSLKAGVQLKVIYDWKVIKALFISAWPFLIIAFIDWINGYGNSYFIDLIFEEFEVSLFVFALTLTSVMQLLASSMNQVWAPRFFNLSKSQDSKDIERHYNNYSTIQGIVLGGIGGALIVFVPFILTLLDGYESYVDISFELTYLFAGYILLIPWWHSQNYFLVNNDGKVLMLYTMIAGVVGYLIWISLMIILGRQGIYIGFLCQMLIKALIVYFVARKKYAIQFQWQGVAVGLFLLISLSFIQI